MKSPLSRRARPLPPLAALAVAAVLAASPQRVLADEVALPGGTRLTGVVLTRDDTGVTLLLPDGGEIRLAAADVATVTPDEDAPTRDRTVRFVDRGEEGAVLQVAVAHLLAPTGGPRVDLIGAVHIADRAFFREVQAQLEQADVVLFEMVKPKDAAPGEMDEGPSNPIREFQAKLGKALDLVFQLDEIEYDRPHFVHADMTTEEMAGGMPGGEKPEDGSPAGAAPRLPAQIQAMLPMIRMMNGMLDGMIASAEGGGNLGLKRTFARVMGSLGPKAGALMGAEMSELLLSRRNAVVVERLKEVAPGTKTVAVFYGAAHLPDLEKRIVEQLGYRRAGARWMDAWRIPLKTDRVKAEPAREPLPAGSR